MQRDRVAAISAVAALDDPHRRRLYEAVRVSRQPLTREEAAAIVDISRKLAAFHLDKLVDCGLLEVVADPLPGPRNVGRAPKRYQPVDTVVAVSIPARSFEELAAILLRATETALPGESPEQAISRVATAQGRIRGATAKREPADNRPRASRALARVESVLAEEGYEPYSTARGSVRLANCPFHPLANQGPDLVCGINLNYLAGLLEGLKLDSLRVVLVPAWRECCVEIRPVT